MSRVTGMIAVSNAGQENLGVKLEAPSQDVDPGEEVRFYLWGRDEESLRGYALAQGADPVGAARLNQYLGQTEAAVFDLDGEGGLKAFSWPVLQLLGVEAMGALYAIDGNDVRRLAGPGDDVTSLFRLSGNALAPAVGAPKAIGTVRATGARSPWCLEWRWTTPPKPATGLPAGTCSDDEDDRDSTLYWFFLTRFGVLFQEFSLALAFNADFWGDDVPAEGEEAPFDFGREPLLWFDAREIEDADGEVLTSLIDRVGNMIELSGALDVWFVHRDAVDCSGNVVPDVGSFEPYIHNGEYWKWFLHTGETEDWDGVLPGDAVKEYRCETAYDATSYGRPCMRLSTDCTKAKSFGLLWSGWGAFMYCAATFSNALKRTVFVAVAGEDAYAIGPSSSVLNFVPPGYAPRESISLEIKGDSTGDIGDPRNPPMAGGGAVLFDFTMPTMGGKKKMSETDVEYSGDMRWGSGPDMASYGMAGSYVKATPSLLTLEFDGEAGEFRIYQNGELKESFFALTPQILFALLPITTLGFTAVVDHLNDTYDTMGVTYATHQDVFTALLFDGLFDAAKRQEIEAYLMKEWGIS